jgi:hypothetical protein
LYRLGKLVRGAKYPVNEVVVCRTLQLKPTEALSSHKLLSKLLEVAKRGKAGSNKDGWDTIAHGRIDLSDEENSLGVVMLRSGQRQSFKSSSLTTHTEVSVHPRWFIPAKQYRPKAFIAPKHVVQIVRLLTRDDSWLACIQGNGGAANESKLKPFLDELTGMVDEWDTFERVTADLRPLLENAGVVEPRTRAGGRGINGPVPGQAPTGSLGSTPKSTTVEGEQRENRGKRKERVGGVRVDEASCVSVPDEWKLKELVKDKNILAEVEASLRMVDDWADHKDREEWLSRLDSSSTAGTIARLGQASIGQLRFIVRSARNKVLSEQWIQWPDEMLLVKILDTCGRISSGEMLAAQNTKVHAQTGQPFLTDEAAAILRAIVFEFDISLTRMPTLLCYFSLFFLRRSPTEAEFISRRSLLPRIQRLQWVDEQHTNTELEEYLCGEVNGFPKYFYSITDDSKHFKRVRHVLIASNYSQGQRGFQFISATHAGASDALSEAKLNARELTSTFTPEIMAHYGGGAGDNAADAQLEIRETHRLILANIPVPRQTVFGIERRPISIGDFYHVDNLVLVHFSNGAFGEYDSKDFSYTHHRRVVQSFHDMVSKDKDRAQSELDRILGDTTFNLQATRERQQRWLVNGRQCRYLYDKLAVQTGDGVPGLVALARYMHDDCDSSQRRIAGEVAVWLTMPEILFAIAAEADASEFMEVTSHFHKQGGTAGRAGFALDRVHALYLDYAVPFWERAIVDWKTRLKRSARVFTELSPASQVLYDKKMKVGAQAAHDEIAAMLRKLMSAPLIFLLLRDPDRGGALCRALHHVLKDAFDFGVGWESYGIASVRPLFEAKLIGLLELDLNNTRHFFQQFGLARAVTLPDLCALGKEPPGQRTSRKVFRGKYPVLDDALEAVYHLCPSSSLLAEQAHGMLRNTMKSHDSLEMTDLKMAHKMNNAYGVRRKVRQAKQESEERNDRASGTEGGGRAAKRRKESTKLHERKEDSQRQAQLLLESLSRYAQSAVDAMPGLPTVKSLRKTGLKRLDNDARTRQEEAAATTRARRTRQPRTDADWAAAASQVQVKNDQDWVHPDEDRRKKDTKRFVEMPLWNKMRKPKMIEDLNKVFTTFHVDVVEDWKGKTKKDILLLIQEHIKKVGRVVAREESNTLLPTVSVADMSRDEAMAVFVNADGSDVLCTERAERGRTAAAMKEVFRLCGQTCNDMICESIQ